MFFEKNTVRNPDSPRHQSTTPWLFNKSLRSKNHYVPELKKFNKIDHLKNHEDIKHGYIYAKYNNNDKNFTFVFKHAPGIYRAYGFLEGSIEIPLPELYICGQIILQQNEDGTYKIRNEDIHLGSTWLSALPLSNLYTNYSHPEPRVYVSNNKYVHYTPVCSGSILHNRTQNSKTPLEVINKCASYFTSFLLNHGNTDLPIYSYDTNRQTYEDYDEYDDAGAKRITGHEIGAILANEPTDEHLDRQATAETYQRYWLFLNMIKDNDTPENIYARIRKYEYLSDVLTEFDLSIEEINDYYDDHQSSDTPLIMRRNYD